MENEIKEFFRQTAPQPSDPTAFTLELNARLSAVEQVKAYRDREIRRSHRILIAVFAAGLLLGGAIASFLILHPVQLPAWMSHPELAEGLGPKSPSFAAWFWPVAGPITLLAIALPLLLTRRSRKVFL